MDIINIETDHKEDISNLLVAAFNIGYQLGFDHANRQIGIDESQTGDNTLIYKMNGKEYRQMTLEDIENGL